MTTTTTITITATPLIVVIGTSTRYLRHCNLNPILGSNDSQASSDTDLKRRGDVRPSDGGTAQNDPFGNESGEGVHYKTLYWWQCSLLMIAETISLGILSLPAVISRMGFVPGVLLITILGAMATYTGYVCGQFKMAHPAIHSFSDAGHMIFGKWACLSITIAVVITMIGVGILRPNIHSAVLVAVSNPTSTQAYAVGISNIVIAFTGHTAYFSFISELRQPKDFPKSLALLQSMAITFYIVVAVVIYYYAGDTVSSPALGSASPLIRKIAYGIASPTIVVAGVVNAHVCVKNIYVRMWRGTNIMRERSRKSIGSWLLLTAGVWVLAFLIAESIPVFHELLGIMGALLCSWFSLGLPAWFWLWLNTGQWTRDWRKKVLTGVNIGICVCCIVVCVLGTYGSIKAILHSSATQRPFSCADNSL
ncbi:Transmembrane amino acid transporter-like protein 8 [Elsinoe fawcettii]|nr:Transmembrane amino acid transporter-like protein 8 [Elsinoe fawcettii]